MDGELGFELDEPENGEQAPSAVHLLLPILLVLITPFAIMLLLEFPLLRLRLPILLLLIVPFSMMLFMEFSLLHPLMLHPLMPILLLLVLPSEKMLLPTFPLLHPLLPIRLLPILPFATMMSPAAAPTVAGPIVPSPPTAGVPAAHFLLNLRRTTATALTTQIIHCSITVTCRCHRQ